MRLLTMKQVRELVLYCPTHIRRLEKVGAFPRRVRLGKGPRSRVGWVEKEVLDWLTARINERPIDPPTPDEE